MLQKRLVRIFFLPDTGYPADLLSGATLLVPYPMSGKWSLVMVPDRCEDWLLHVLGNLHLS